MARASGNRNQAYSSESARSGKKHNKKIAVAGWDNEHLVKVLGTIRKVSCDSPDVLIDFRADLM